MTNGPNDWSWDFTPQVEPENPEPQRRDTEATESTSQPAATGPQDAPAGPALPDPSGPTDPAADAPSGQSSQFAQYASGAAAASPSAYTRFQRYDVDDYQPGVMPLRPLRFAEFFDCAFRTLRFNPQTMFSYSAIVMAFGIIAYIVIHPTMMELLHNPREERLFSSFGTMAWQSMLQGLLTVVVVGFLVYAVVGAVQGNKLTFTEVWQAMKGKILPLIGLIITAGVLTLLLAGIFATVSFLLVWLAFSGDGNLAFGAIVGIIVVFLPFVMALVVMLYTAIAMPILVVENTGVFRSLRRSVSLVKGYFWRSFALLGLAWIVVGVITSVIGGLIAPLITALLQSAGVLTTEYAAESATLISTMGISSAVQVLTTPFIAAFLTLVYTDIRMRKEGLDIALIEASAAQR